MISAARAYMISQNVKYDKKVVITELKNIENEITRNAKRLGTISLKYKIDLSIPEKNLFATYIKLLKCLRRSHYQVNIQTEKYCATKEEISLWLSTDKMNKWKWRTVRGNRIDKCGTYLYISWDKRKENE